MTLRPPHDDTACAGAPHLSASALMGHHATEHGHHETPRNFGLPDDEHAPRWQPASIEMLFI